MDRRMLFILQGRRGLRITQSDKYVTSYFRMRLLR